MKPDLDSEGARRFRYKPASPSAMRRKYVASEITLEPLLNLAALRGTDLLRDRLAILEQ